MAKGTKPIQAAAAATASGGSVGFFDQGHALVILAERLLPHDAPQWLLVGVETGAIAIAMFILLSAFRGLMSSSAAIGLVIGAALLFGCLLLARKFIDVSTQPLAAWLIRTGARLNGFYTSRLKRIDTTAKRLKQFIERTFRDLTPRR